MMPTYSTALAAAAASALLLACDQGRSAFPPTLSNQCSGVALLNDSSSVRPILHPPSADHLLIGPALSIDVTVGQSTVDCDSKQVVLAVSDRAPRDRNSRLEVLDLDRLRPPRTIPIPEGINGFLLRGEHAYVATARARRAPVDPNLGALTPSETPIDSPIDHIFTELLKVDIGTGTVSQRLRYPFPRAEWLDGEHVVTTGSAVLRMSLADGRRDLLFDFATTFDPPNRVAAFFFLEGKLFAVTGGENHGSPSFKPPSIYRLDAAQRAWHLQVSIDERDALFAFGYGTHIYVFPRKLDAVHVVDVRSGKTERVPFAGDDGVEVQSATALNGGILFIAMKPIPGRLGYFDPTAHLYLASPDFKQVIAHARAEGVGNAPSLSSSLVKWPQSGGGMNGYLRYPY
jgi:hypothetical protein